MSAAKPSAQRASDDDREQVFSRLEQAYSEGQLGRHEYDRRRHATLNATTQADLLPLIRDLLVEEADFEPPETLTSALLAPHRSGKLIALVTSISAVVVVVVFVVMVVILLTGQP
ncbi:MAG: DUF1707 SHOCT-like domain-containing protein [Corynebacterium sp.]|uniref:DUF1707 SHOCT-like domain-containing protein n=1 Tax=Corynebacterium sp. TaxID=1720 RepID=UPI003F9E6009